MLTNLKFPNYYFVSVFLRKVLIYFKYKYLFHL